MTADLKSRLLKAIAYPGDPLVNDPMCFGQSEHDRLCPLIEALIDCADELHRIDSARCHYLFLLLESELKKMGKSK